MITYLKERCASDRTALLEAQLATEDEFQAVWPGTPGNPKRDVHAWLHAFRNCARFFARAEARQEFTHGENAARSDQLLTLQQGEPKVVRLAVPVVIDGDTRTELQLHHKSFSALRTLATYARIATNLLVQAGELEAHIAASDTAAELLFEAHAWRERILLMLVWGATTEGAGLPWAPRTTPWPDVPTWLTQLDPMDLIALQFAYTEQYGRALMAISPFLAPSEDGKDPLSGWETFFASYATEKGLEAQALMNDRAFLPFLTQVTLAGHSARRAREEAKAASESPAGAG